MMNINTLTGILGGSLVTLIIKELLNQFNKHQDFNRELIKITYVKKLEKAENATAFYWTCLNKLTEMKKSLDFVIIAVNEFEDNAYDLEIIEDLMNKTSQTLTDLASEKYLNINSIHLYFDLEDTEKWNENDMSKLIKALSETKSIDNEIRSYVDLHNNSIQLQEFEKSDLYWNNAIEILPTYVNSLQNFIDCIEKNKNALYGIVKKIKKDLKQYS
jgi:hypothetical protein